MVYIDKVPGVWSWTFLPPTASKLQLYWRESKVLGVGRPLAEQLVLLPPQVLAPRTSRVVPT